MNFGKQIHCNYARKTSRGYKYDLILIPFCFRDRSSKIQACVNAKNSRGGVFRNGRFVRDERNP